MADILPALLGGVVGGLCGYVICHRLTEREYPYQFHCPDPNCHLVLRSNNMALLDILIGDHQRALHRERGAE